MDKPKSANRPLLPVEASARAPGSVLRLNPFDAGTSIKVECVNVKLLDDCCIYCAFINLQTILLSVNRQLFAIRNKPLADPRILFSGVEKAPQAGLGVQIQTGLLF
jgi:hypothetical protein